MSTDINVSSEILDKARIWTSEPFDEETRKEVRSMIESNPDLLMESFYTDLEFGTGGMRGIMGAGTNRVNEYTIGLATQGLANYVNQSFPNIKPKMAIAHDCRNGSKEFAHRAADVLAANGIDVYLFEDLRPTPELSFAIRNLGCQSGIVITASHNPKEYNGYKVYWDDGGQVISPHDKGIIEQVRKLDFSDVRDTGGSGSVQMLGAEMDAEYLRAVSDQLLDISVIRDHGDVGIVYTALHGTGITMIPKALAEFGFSNVTVVPEQDVPDGNFTTVESPNPEEREALSRAIALAEKQGADLVMGTDPDTDRVGIAVKGEDGKFVLLNGNETGVLLIYYHLLKWKEAGKLDGKQFVARTIVTTKLIDRICESFGVNTYVTLTGFKYIAGLIRDKEANEQYILGGEESFGYLIGDFVRDKDGVTACVMLAEIMAWAKSEGFGLLELLEKIHQEFGYFDEDLISLKKEGKQGKEEIAKLMNDMRSNPPASLGGSAVVMASDYSNGISRNIQDGSQSQLEQPSSNVLQFETEDGSVVTARPSGTEPKIKFYFSVNSSGDEGSTIVKKGLKDRIEAIKSDLGLLT